MAMKKALNCLKNTITSCLCFNVSFPIVALNVGYLLLILKYKLIFKYKF